MHLWGSCAIKDLKSEPYKNWYDKNTDEYETNLQETDAKLLSDVTVKIFLGTWCGDTKYLVPKFLKTWESLGLTNDKIELIALHNESGKYKQGPNDETSGYNIHRVPTLIFSRKGQEIGRIVERPIFTLDQDITTITAGGSYKERYQAVTLIDKYLRGCEIDSLFTISNIDKAKKLIRRELTYWGELNSYGYVLRDMGKEPLAGFVFLLNKKLYPYNPRVINSYAEWLKSQKKYDEALKEYQESLRILKIDEYTTRQIAKVYDALNMENSAVNVD